MMPLTYTGLQTVLITGLLLGFTYGADSHSKMEVTEGSSFSLRCEIEMPPDSALVWRKLNIGGNGRETIIVVGGLLVIPDNRYKIRDENGFELRNVTLGDAGVYECFHSGDNSPRLTYTINVKGKAGPIVSDDSTRKPLRLMMPRYAIRAQIVETYCQFELGSDSIYAIKWYKDNNELARYVPKEVPTVKQFRFIGGSVTNVTVFTSVNGTTTATLLLRMDTIGSGTYSCEMAGDAPDFRTEVGETVMTVVDNDFELSKLANTSESPEVSNSLDAHLSNIQTIFRNEKQILSRQLEILETEHLLKKKLLTSQLEYYNTLKEALQRS